MGFICCSAEPQMNPQPKGPSSEEHFHEALILYPDLQKAFPLLIQWWMQRKSMALPPVE